jgi:archaellum component FlaG (FlaF/FlaG flagellin family)
MILLITGLIVAALVSGVLLQSWDEMSGVLDQRGRQGMEDVKTRVSLASDPINIGWYATHPTVDTGAGNETAVIYLQNSGDTFLDVDDVGVSLNGSVMAVTKCDCVTQWLPGEIVEFTIHGSALADDPDYFPASGCPVSCAGYPIEGTYDVYLSVTVVSTSGSYAGVDTLNEEVRISA